MYNFRKDHILQPKFTSLVRKVEALKSKNNDHVEFVQDICRLFNSIAIDVNVQVYTTSNKVMSIQNRLLEMLQQSQWCILFSIFT